MPVIFEQAVRYFDQAINLNEVPSAALLFAKHVMLDPVYKSAHFQAHNVK